MHCRVHHMIKACRRFFKFDFYGVIKARESMSTPEFNEQWQAGAAAEIADRNNAVKQILFQNPVDGLAGKVKI